MATGDIFRPMKTLPGLPGIYASEGKHDTTYYALVQNRNGKWLRRKVGTRKEGCSPAVAAARKIELQKQLSGGVDPDQNDKVTYGQAHKSYLKTRMSNGSDVTRDIDRHTLYLSRFDDPPHLAAPALAVDALGVLRRKTSQLCGFL